MAALCLDASLEMLQPFCYRGTYHLQGDLCCCCFHEGSLQTLQVVVMLLASHVLQNSPQFIVPGVEVWTPRGSILGAVKGRNVPPQPLLSRLGFWAGTESCWKTHSWPRKTVTLSCFTAPCSTSSWYTWTPVSPLSCKNEDVSHPGGTPPVQPWCRKGDGLPACLEHFPSPHWTFEHKSCCSGGCTAPWWWRFSHLWRGCFCAHSQRATGGDALLLSIRSSSEQE